MPIITDPETGLDFDTDTGEYLSPEYVTKKALGDDIPIFDEQGFVLNKDGTRAGDGTGGGLTAVDNGDYITLTDNGSGQIIDNGDYITII